MTHTQSPSQFSSSPPPPSSVRPHRSPSLEYLSPSLHSASRSSTLYGAVFSLSSTILGGGVLSLPFCFSLLGLGFGSVFLIILALASDFSIYILVCAAVYIYRIERRRRERREQREIFEEQELFLKRLLMLAITVPLCLLLCRSAVLVVFVQALLMRKLYQQHGGRRRGLCAPCYCSYWYISAS